jgi:hypothetical protein
MFVNVGWLVGSVFWSDVRSVETVEYKNISFTVWDVGGQDKVLLVVTIRASRGVYACMTWECILLNMWERILVVRFVSVSALTASTHTHTHILSFSLLHTHTDPSSVAPLLPKHPRHHLCGRFQRRGAYRRQQRLRTQCQGGVTPHVGRR